MAMLKVVMIGYASCMRGLDRMLSGGMAVSTARKIPNNALASRMTQPYLSYVLLLLLIAISPYSACSIFATSHCKKGAPGGAPDTAGATLDYAGWSPSVTRLPLAVS